MHRIARNPLLHLVVTSAIQPHPSVTQETCLLDGMLEFDPTQRLSMNAAFQAFTAVPWS
jgi:hypothetical protein